MCACPGHALPAAQPTPPIGCRLFAPAPVTACSGEHPEEQIAVLFRTHIQARLVEQELVR